MFEYKLYVWIKKDNSSLNNVSKQTKSQINGHVPALSSCFSWSWVVCLSVVKVTGIPINCRYISPYHTSTSIAGGISRQTCNVNSECSCNYTSMLMIYSLLTVSKDKQGTWSYWDGTVKLIYIIWPVSVYCVLENLYRK